MIKEIHQFRQIMFQHHKFYQRITVNSYCFWNIPETSLLCAFLPSHLFINIHNKNMIRLLRTPTLKQYLSSIKAYNSSKNYYKSLNLPETATQKDIKKSFRDLAKKYHPDSNKGKEQAFKEINEAYQVLSDETIKRQYDEERRLKNPPNPSPYSSHSHHQSQPPRGQQSTNYRGYQREEGWQNKNFREQFMHDLYRTQQADFNRHFSQSDRVRFEREFREKMESVSRQNSAETIRRYSEQAKRKQAEARRKYEQEQRKEEERQREYFKNYKDPTYFDSNDKLKEKLNKVADGIAHNVKDFLSIAEEVKSFWNNFKKKK